MEEFTKDFFETAKSRGFQMDKLYEWIMQNNSSELIIEQRAEIQKGLSALREKELQQAEAQNSFCLLHSKKGRISNSPLQFNYLFPR